MNSLGRLLGLVFLGLSVRVVIGRARFGVLIGDGGQKVLGQRIRRHANGPDPDRFG